MIYTTEKRSRFNKEKEELEFYWVAIKSYKHRRCFLAREFEYKEVCGDKMPLGMHPHMKIITIPYEFSTKEKAEQYIKDIQSL